MLKNQIIKFRLILIAVVSAPGFKNKTKNKKTTTQKFLSVTVIF